MRILLLFIMIFLLVGCNPSGLNKKDDNSKSLLAQFGLLFVRSNRASVSGTAVKGIVKNGFVTATSLGKNGVCDSRQVLDTGYTDEQGDYSILFNKSGTAVCVTISSSDLGNTTVYDEKKEADVFIPYNSGFKLTTIFPEDKIQGGSKKNINASPFSRILASRLQFLVKQAGDKADISALHTKASKEVVIRFGLHNGLNLGNSPNNRIMASGAGGSDISDANYPEMDEILIELDKPNSPLTAKFLSILSGFSYLANTHKKGSDITPEDMDAIIEAFAKDFEDGVFDGKDSSGAAISIGFGGNQVAFSSTPLTTILFQAIINYFSQGGKLNSGYVSKSSVTGSSTKTITVSSTEINSQVQFVDNTKIVSVYQLAGLTTPPVLKASGLSFPDKDGNTSQIGGTVTINKAIDESFISSYALYYGSSATTKTTLIADIPKTGSDLTYTIPMDTSSAVAPYLIVYTKNYLGEMTDGISVAITDLTDSTGPTAGAGGNITGSGISTSSVTLNWAAATDNFSAGSAIQYLAYYSTANNIATVANAEANGTPIGIYTANITTVTKSGLTGATVYYFNVIAKDEYGFKSPYTMQVLSTLDGTAPVPGNTGTITSASVTANSLTLNWTYGTDTVSPQANLQYKVVRSLSNNISIVADAETNGTLVQDWTANINTLNVTGLSDSTTYYFTVLIQDTSSNKAVYNTLPVSTLDVTAPVVGGGGTINSANITPNSVDLSWTAGTDTLTAQASLQYKVVYSTSNNISSVATAETNGTLSQDWTTNLLTKTVSGLSNASSYYLTVLIKDAAGNKSAYNFINITTLNDTTPPTVASTTPTDGGSLATTASFANDLTLVFSEAVNTGTLSMQAANGACSGSIQLSSNNFSTCLAGVLTTTGNPSITINPNANLADNLTYKIRVTTAVTDLVGNAMSSTYTMATGILTRKPPTVISQTYTSCTGFPCSFTITFSEPMDTTTGGAGASFSLPSGNSACFVYRTIKVATAGDTCFQVTRDAASDSGNTYGFIVADNTTSGVGSTLYLTVKGADDPTYFVTDAVGTPKATTQQWSVGF